MKIHKLLLIAVAVAMLLSSCVQIDTDKISDAIESGADKAGEYLDEALPKVSEALTPIANDAANELASYLGINKQYVEYEKTLNTFFDALDKGDKETIYNLFSPMAQKADAELKDDIDKLVALYTGPTDEVLWDGDSSGPWIRNDGKNEYYATSSFLVRSGDTYYWCYLKLLYEYDEDPKQIGITELEFYTADEYCISQDNWFFNNERTENTLGLTVYSEQTLDCEVRLIEGKLHKYTPTEQFLNIDAVKEFLDSCYSYVEFVNQFGEPNAFRAYYYYELPLQDGAPRYLKISLEKGNIFYANIVRVLTQ